MRLRSLLFFILIAQTSVFGAPKDQAAAARQDGIAVTLAKIEGAFESHNAAAYTALLEPNIINTEPTTAFVQDWIVPGVTRAAVRERLRTPAQNVPAGDGFDVYVDVLVESGRTGRVGTWLIEFRRDPAAADAWRIAGLEVLTAVGGLYQLQLAADKEYTVENFVLNAEDFQARLPKGVAFVSETPEGVTAMVLLGRGDFTFSPAPAAEKGQVRIFSGAESLQRGFDGLYLRLEPTEFNAHVSHGTLTPREMDPRDFKRADALFQDNVGRTFGLNLADLSRDTWSVLPKLGDVVAEIQSEKTHLTYMHEVSDAEDIRFFDRTHQKTISVYASKDKLAERGPFYNEDDSVDVDILNYDIDASFDPAREWMEGNARVLLVAKKEPVSTIIMNLAEPLAIRSVVSRKFGYVMALRVTGQDDIVINLPQPLQPNVILDLEFVYGGRLPAKPPDREALQLEKPNEYFTPEEEPSFVYTGRSGWYPQSSVTDYATANLALRVPEKYSSVATGEIDEGFPKLVNLEGRTWRQYQYSATQPVRYLGWAISRFNHVESAVVSMPPAAAVQDDRLPMTAGVSYTSVDISVESTRTMKNRALEMSDTAQDAMKFYASLVGDMPYQTFSLAVVEGAQPGGHSPPYFASMVQPPPAMPVAWRNDPAYFSDFPEFFVAHEAAHQWWGQAVGWKNYHEQWLSEGFAQYFAALYAEHLHRDDVFPKVIAQMSRFAADKSDQGPVYLGYRLGHLKNDSRIFRSVIYNKGAIVLHMLRRLLGDDAFFSGIKRYYLTERFKKAGTEDLRAAFEHDTHRSLERFFDRWIYNAELPRLKFSYRIEGDDAVVRFEQIGDLFDVPITVTINYGNPVSSADILVPITERITEQRIPVKGTVRSVEANRDNASPVIFVK